MEARSQDGSGNAGDAGAPKEEPKAVKDEPQGGNQTPAEFAIRLLFEKNADQIKMLRRGEPRTSGRPHVRLAGKSGRLAGVSHGATPVTS